jgi:hypothetical protein
MPNTDVDCSVQLSVQQIVRLRYMCGTCAVHMQYMWSICALHVQNMCRICAVYVQSKCSTSTLPTQIWSKLGANSSKREFIRAKWEQIPHTSKYTTGMCSSFALVLLLTAMVFPAEFTRMRWNRWKRILSHRSNCAFDVLILKPRFQWTPYFGRNIESKLGANYEQIYYLCSAVFQVSRAGNRSNPYPVKRLVDEDKWSVQEVQVQVLLGLWLCEDVQG